MKTQKVAGVYFRGAAALVLVLGLAAAGTAQTKAPAKRPRATAQGAPATGARPPRLVIRQHTLANGLRLLMAEDHSTPVVSLQMWYHVGSKDERPGRTGFAHLFEHLMFKGSAHVGPDEHSRLIEAVGGTDNAGTIFDYTYYFQVFPSHYLERVIWLEADRLGSLNVDQANFQSEREVVKEERRFRYENQPYGLLWEDIFGAAFSAHPYKHLPIGSMEDLNQATVADVQDFFRTYYRPDNVTVVMVGDFVPAQAIAWTAKYFGGVPRPKTPVPRVAVREPEQAGERRVTKSYGSNSPLPAVVGGYKVPSIYTPDSYPLSLAANILSQGESSRLYRKLVYEDRVAVQTFGSPFFTEHPGLFFAVAILNQGKTLADGEKALNGVLEQMKNTPVSETELQKAKNQIIAEFVLGRRTVDQKATAVGSAATLGKDPERLNTDLGRYLAVTAADIQRVAQTYFDAGRRTVLLIEPPQAPGKN